MQPLSGACHVVAALLAKASIGNLENRGGLEMLLNAADYEMMSPVPAARRRPEPFVHRKLAKRGRCIVIEERRNRKDAGKTASNDTWAKLGSLMEEVVETRGMVFAHGDRRYGICMFGADDEMSDTSILAFAEFLSSFIRKTTSMQVNIGIGASVRSYAEMSRSISSAIRVLEGAYREDQGHVLLYAENEGGALLEQVKRLVRETYAEASCSLMQIAKAMFVNSAYLGRLFKEKEGISFKDYVNGVRMEKAKELLTASDMKVYEIAYAVGYREVDWFYKKFKEYTGMSTQEYRAMNKVYFVR